MIMRDLNQLGVSAENYIRELHDQNLKFYSDKRGKGAIGNLQQTFPYTWIYIAELIQNAIDEGARKLAFLIQSGTLVFEHDGEPFKHDDVEGLCTRGVSTKSAKTIGFMGVGFKSVFKSFQRADISSGEWKFSLKVPVKVGLFEDKQRDWLGCVLPTFSPHLPGPSEGMSCRFSLSERLDGLDEIENDLREVLQKDFSLLPLLAIHGIEELVWGNKEYLLSKSEPEIYNQDSSRTVVESMDIKDDRLPVTHWVLFSKTYKPSERAIKRFLEHRELIPETEEDEEELRLEVSKPRAVQIFCRLDQSGNPILPEKGRAFSVLPTNVYFPLRISIQADWLLDISRSGLMDFKNNPWHEEILEQLPVLVRSFLEWLVGANCPKEEGWNEGYNIIPHFDDNDPALLWFNNESLIERFKTELLPAAFLPIMDETGLVFLSPEESRYLPEPLATLFDEDELYPWDLFGSGIISVGVLGEIPFESLSNLDLLRQIQAQELTDYWESDAVGKWLSHWNDAEKKKSKMVFLLAALNGLDDDSQV